MRNPKPIFIFMLIMMACNGTILTSQVFCQLNPGDILIIDSDAGQAGKGALFSVDPSGTRKIISDFGDPGSPMVSLGEDPFAVAVAPSGDAFVLDVSARCIFRVDLSTRKRECFHDLDFAPSDAPVVSPTNLAIDASGNILLLDKDAGTGEPIEGDMGNGALFRINPATLFRERLLPTLGEEPSRIAIDASGNILVTDMRALPNDPGRLYVINPSSPFAIKTFNFSTQNCDIRRPHLLAVESSNTLLIIDDSPFGTRLFRFLMSTESCDFLASQEDFGDIGGAALGGVAVDTAGNILIVNDDAGPNKAGALFLGAFDPNDPNIVIFITLSGYPEILLGNKASFFDS
ncbi:MAG: hypothetical protein L0Y56_20735 [Nitrospira sp.]|nr:hypothetical protein [Nitrospira sp.]